jgi:hypothetical protein
MKIYFLIPAVGILALTGCTELTPEDNQRITSANQSAQEAKQQSAQALEEARAARMDADKSAKAAQMAGEKADRIFRQGQNK